MITWELTRACSGTCRFCRTRSGAPLPDEWTRGEALKLANQLAEWRVQRVMLSGGEPLRFPPWKEVVKTLVWGGIQVRISSSGAGLDASTLAWMEEAGVGEIALSLDGLGEVHDRLRPLVGQNGSSFALAEAALTRLLESRLAVRVVTAVSPENLPFLPSLYHHLRDRGVTRWQVQWVQPQGRALDDSARLIPAPKHIQSVYDVLVLAAHEGRMRAPLHCSLGYMTPEEPLLRGRGGEGPGVWMGPQAGLRSLFIDARGGVSGCPCLPEEFVTASARTRPLKEIWEDDTCFPYTRGWTPEVLAGACRTCSLAKTCRAGCLSVAWGLTGTIGLNPLCLREERRRMESP